MNVQLSTKETIKFISKCIDEYEEHDKSLLQLALQSFISSSIAVVELAQLLTSRSMQYHVVEAILSGYREEDLRGWLSRNPNICALLLEKKRFVAMEYLCSRYIKIKDWKTLIAKMGFIDDMHPFVAFLDKWLLNNYGSVDDFDNEKAIGAINDNTKAMMNFIGYVANIFRLASNPRSLQIDLDTFKPLIQLLVRIMEDPITSRLVNQKNRKIINKFIDKNDKVKRWLNVNGKKIDKNVGIDMNDNDDNNNVNNVSQNGKNNTVTISHSEAMKQGLIKEINRIEKHRLMSKMKDENMNRCSYIFESC